MPRTRTPRAKNPPFFLIEPLELRRLLAATTPSGALSLGTTTDDTVTGITAVANLGGNGHVTFVTGTFSGAMVLSTGTGGITLTSKGGTDIYLIAYFDDNTIDWAQSFGSTGNDISGDVVIAGTNVVMTGSFTGTMVMSTGTGGVTLTSKGGTDGFFARFADTTGTLSSAKSFGGTGNSDTANQIAADTAGNIYYLGTFSGTVDLDPGTAVQNRTSFSATDPFMAKVSTTNNLTFVEHYTTDETITFANVCTSPGAGVTPCWRAAFWVGCRLRWQRFDPTIPSPPTANWDLSSF